MASILNIVADKCRHFGGVQKICPFPNNTSILEICYDIHGSSASAELKSTKGTFTVHGSPSPAQSTNTNTNLPEVDTSLCVSDIVQFGIRTLYIKCKQEENTLLDTVKKAAEEATHSAANAFELLMGKGRVFLDKKNSSSGAMSGSINAKDGLYNKLVDLFVMKHLDFPKGSKAEGQYLIQVLCNALWYITNHHETIKEASRVHYVKPVPPPFDSPEFQDLNNFKRKKIKTTKLSETELQSHCQAVYSLLLKPFMRSSPSWCTVYTEIKSLADCFSSYCEYLNKKNENMQKNHNLDHPVKTVGEHATVEHKAKCILGIKQRYSIVNDKVSSLNIGEHIFFDENEHLEQSFKTNNQRARYFEDLQLSVPIDLYRFSPGGGIVATVCIVRVVENRTIPQILTQGARFVMQHKDDFKEYHTRAQKRAFKESLNNIVGVLPSVSEFIYKELALYVSKAAHPDMQERLRLIFLGHKGLVADLRKLNTGRPSQSFDVFFEQLQSIVETKTAADDRRHGEAHLSEWLSLEDMIQQAKQRCPENTPIPSKSLVRLQFSPRNPYAKTSWNFTSRINVQYKIQRRQLRLSHPDEHYCNALLKYLKEFAVEMKTQCNVAMFACDDKAKVPIGEPGFAVSTGVRGKQTIVPTSSTLVAGDHDMTKSSLTPSVSLQCEIPDSSESSFVRGKVHVTVNDSVFQSSNPFRHAATLIKILEQEHQPNLNILIMYTDGGTDHRNTLASVQCSVICLFKELNVDMLVLCRCAPGHSWRNPAERIMSLLNIGLQNCSLERTQCTDEVEKQLKKYGSMKDIREKSGANVKQAYSESVQSVQRTVQNRFSRLKLKGASVEILDPTTEEDIDLCKRHLRELFPGLNLQKLVKNVTKKVPSFTQWMENHCRERHYSFQLKKCDDESCCIKSPLSDNVRLDWLPDPVLLDDREHYRSYQDSKGKVTEESDRPTFKEPERKQVTKPKTAKKRALNETTDDRSDNATEENMDVEQDVEPSVSEETESEAPFPLTAQTARGVVDCVECEKPRVYYCKTKLSGRQTLLLITSISENDYTCGSPLSEHELLKNVYTRTALTCGSQVEFPYYSSDFARFDVCAYCGDTDASVDAELKKRFRTVLPICNTCKNKGKKTVTKRPYGKEK